MNSKFNLIPILVCCSLSGCAAIEASRVLPIRPSSHSRSFNVNDPVEAQQALASINREFLDSEIANAQRGSQVNIVDASDRRYIGTLLSASRDGVELMNCVCREAVPGPNDQKQCKTSHVPFQSLKRSSMTHFMAISPPPPDFVPPELAEDGRDVTVDAIVFKSGRRQRWGRPPDQGEAHQASDSVEEE